MKSIRYIIVLLAVKVINNNAQSQYSLNAGFAGTFNKDGDIWSITTKDYAISVERLAVNMDAITVQIEIWYRPGAADTEYYDSYTQVFDEEVTGQGQGNSTLLPSFVTPIEIPANSTYTIYSSSLASSPFALYHTPGVSGVNQPFLSDDNIDINEGYSARFPFLLPEQPTRWNGVVYYSIPQPSARPSQAPSVSMNPSNEPSVNPSMSVQPSFEPSGIPTSSSLPSSLPSVSANPSSEPSFNPTESTRPSLSVMPTLNPSATPSVTTEPSGEPSSVPSESNAPSSRPSLGPSRSSQPSYQPSLTPSQSSSPSQSSVPSISLAPSKSSSPSLSHVPSVSSSPTVSASPSSKSSSKPSTSSQPSHEPSRIPSSEPSMSEPSFEPSISPSKTANPSLAPSLKPSWSGEPSLKSSGVPSSQPSLTPSKSTEPSDASSISPSTSLTPSVTIPNGEEEPSYGPGSSSPSREMSSHPSMEPTAASPTEAPSDVTPVTGDLPTPLSTELPSMSILPTNPLLSDR